MHSPFIRLSLFAVALLLPMLLNAQGVVTLLNVKAPVTVTAADGQVVTNPANGFRTGQGATVTTGAGGGVLLVFSTGTTMALAGDSSLTIDTFSQRPAATPAPAGVEDDSISNTRLTLGYGELQGKVRKLRPESAFEVATPVGVAGVRGTNILIRVMRMGDQWTVSFGVDDGSLTILTLDGQTIEAAGLDTLEDGQTLTLTADQDAEGVITITGAELGNLTTQQIEALQEAVNTQQEDADNLLQGGNDNDPNNSNDPNGPDDSEQPLPTIKDYDDPSSGAGQPVSWWQGDGIPVVAMIPGISG